MTAPVLDRPWHSLALGQTASELESDPSQGLRPEEAARRLESYGRNEIATERRAGRLALLLRQFSDVMIWVLLAAAAISGVLLQEWIETGVILAIVVLNAALGYAQESRAEDALAGLKEMAAPEATVIRAGQESIVLASLVVPGDLVILEAGDRVPADARVSEAIHLEMDESALTGESFPVRKTVDPAKEGSSTADQRSMTFAGTVVAAGRGQALVVRTGRETEVGKLAALLEEREPPTPLQVELARVGRRIAVLSIGVAVLIFGLGLAQQLPVEVMFLTAVALAVAAIPEGLPAVVTITLSRGVTKMARRSAIVRRLPAVEALGSASVICTDKTGTLTQNQIRVQEMDFAGLHVRTGDEVRGDGRLERYAQIAVLCNDARRSQDIYVGDPTEVALLESVDPVLIDTTSARAGYPRLDEIAFDSARKRMTTLHGVNGRFLACVKGAPEAVIGLCSEMEDVAGRRPLPDDRRAAALSSAQELAARGLRTLALAYREFDSEPVDLGDIEQELVLVAVVGMSDAPRPEAGPAVEEAQEAGINVVMVTGDHVITAEAVARDLSILGPEEVVLSGTELRRTSQQQLAHEVQKYAVYARVDPTDKVKIVKAWQARGDIVAMTGDGVNDAPALRSADIGVAMGTGTDVAQEASDMVLADDNFATIIAAVREGRAIFANLKKVVYFLLSANVSEVLVMVAGFLFFAGYGPPLLATQILWVNLITDGLPAVALGVDPPPPGLMERPPDRRRDILGPMHQLRLLWQGGVLALGVIGALMFVLYVRDMPWEHVRTVTLTAIVVTQLLHVYNVRAQGTSVWWMGVGGNSLLHGAVAVSLLLQLAVVYLPVGNLLFATVPIELVDWLVILAISAMSFLAIDLVKRWVLARHPQWDTAHD